MLEKTTGHDCPRKDCFEFNGLLENVKVPLTPKFFFAYVDFLFLLIITAHVKLVFYMLRTEE